MKDTSYCWLQVTSGQGPEECALAAYHIVQRIMQESQRQGLAFALIEPVLGPMRDTYLSALVSITGEGSRIFATGWEGTIQWICQSPYRPAHKRKNWFAGVDIFTPPDEKQSALMQRDVIFETMRASGPGGQHVNTTDSAVRAIHKPTGIAVVAREERSQHMNKKLALAKLANLLNKQHMLHHAQIEKTKWQKHKELERGKPVKIFIGKEFREKYAPS
jgi:peptide chain release factor